MMHQWPVRQAGRWKSGLPCAAMMAQIGPADIKTNQTYDVAGLQDAQLRAADAIKEGFLAKRLG